MLLRKSVHTQGQCRAETVRHQCRAQVLSNRFAAARALKCNATDDTRSVTDSMPSSRRDALLFGGLSLFWSFGGVKQEAQAKGQSSRVAGDFCKPSSEKDGFVVYTPDSRSTPAIRAGVIQPNPDLYSFEIPATWSEGTILNILSGNFCMPKCDEPWIETIWESKTDGFCQLVVSPIYRLVNKSNATVKDLGKPEGVIESVGAFVTGNYLDSVDDDVTKITTEKFKDGREYFVYEIYAPYAKTGTHFGAAVTVKDDLVYLFVVGGNDKQWSSNSSALMNDTLRSFKA